MAAIFGLALFFFLAFASGAGAENVKVGIPSLTVTMLPLAFARENKTQAVSILKRFLKLEDEDLVAKVYDYHKRAETLDGKIDTALAAETIRDARQTEGITREIPVSQVFDFSYLGAAR